MPPVLRNTCEFKEVEPHENVSTSTKPLSRIEMCATKK